MNYLRVTSTDTERSLNCRILHNFLRKSSMSSGKMVGNFAIDPNLHKRSLSSGSPDNVYQFVALSTKPYSTIMS